MRVRLAGFVTTAVLAVLAACSVSQDQEVAIGEQNAAQINAQLPIVNDPGINSYMTDLGRRIASRTSRSDLDWRFAVVNTDQVNAFALPGGFVYINRGLIESTRTEAELAGAIGHEIGHVVQRHSVKQMQSRQKANVGVSLVCTLVNVCDNGLAQAAINVGGTAVFARNSRKDEAQADSEAVVNVMRAGIDPRGVPELLTKLLQQRQEQPTAVEGWFADHPMEESRIAVTRQLIADIPPATLGSLSENSPYYDAMKRRLRLLPAPPPVRSRGAATPDGQKSGEPPAP